MRLLILSIITFLFANNVLSQNEHNIKRDYEKLITEQQILRDNEIKNLTMENYTVRKMEIISKYDKIISRLKNEENNKIIELNKVQRQKEIKKEKELEELNNLKEQRENLQQKENELKEEEERRNAIELEKSEIERIRIENLKKELELEELKKKEIEIEAYKKTIKGTIEKRIKDDMKTWLIKGQYETEAEYKLRLNTNSNNEFQQIVQKNIKKVKEFYQKRFFTEIGSYDIENEIQNIIFFKDTFKLKIKKSIAPKIRDISDGVKTVKGVLIYPKKVEIINNKIKIIEALFFINLGIRDVICWIEREYKFKLIEANNRFFYRCYADVNEENENNIMEKYEYDRKQIETRRLNSTFEIHNISKYDEILEGAFYINWKNDSVDSSEFDKLEYTIDGLEIKIEN